MERFVISAFVLAFAAPAIAKQPSLINPSWQRALGHNYPKDPFAIEWPKRYSPEQLVWLTRYIAYLDARSQGDKSFLATMGYEGFKRYDTAREIAFSMFKEGSHPYGSNCKNALVGSDGSDWAYQVNDKVDIDLTSEDDVENAMFLLAYDATYLFMCLPRLGYSKAVYQQAFLRYERRKLEEISKGDVDADFPPPPPGEFEITDPVAQALILELESQRLRRQPHQPRFIDIDGSGGGESAVLIKLIPADGLGARITRFDYLLCEKKHIDPYDQSKCHGWATMRSGDRPFMAGNYIITVVWPQGRQLRTSVSIGVEKELVLQAPRK